MALNFNLDFGGKWGSTLFMHGPLGLGRFPEFKTEDLIYWQPSASVHSAGTLPGGITQSLKKPACTLLQSGCLAEAQIFFRILAKSQKFSKSQIYAWPHLWMGPHDLWVLMGGPWPPEIYRWPFSLMDGPSVRNIKCLAFGINGVASPLVNGPHRTYGWPPPNLWMAPPPKILRILAQKQTNFTLLHWLIFQN